MDAIKEIKQHQFLWYEVAVSFLVLSIVVVVSVFKFGVSPAENGVLVDLSKIWIVLPLVPAGYFLEKRHRVRLGPGFPVSVPAAWLMIPWSYSIPIAMWVIYTLPDARNGSYPATFGLMCLCGIQVGRALYGSRARRAI